MGYFAWEVVDSATIGSGYEHDSIMIWDDGDGIILSRCFATTGMYFSIEKEMENGLTVRTRYTSPTNGTVVTDSIVTGQGKHESKGINPIKRELGTFYLEKEVYKATPPSVPTSISVMPSTVKEGDTISISWGTGSGATSYRLERSINGGGYSQIYSGSSTSYSDTALSSWNTVLYRVRSYNSDGYSGYRTSTTTVTVKHFPEFNTKVNGVLKTSQDGWVKVDGELKHIEAISVKVDGVLKQL